MACDNRSNRYAIFIIVMTELSKITSFTHDHYRSILSAGLSNGYRFCSFEEIHALRGSNERACLLRHDCDNDLTAARDVALIESDFGVRSTYFVMLRSAMYNALAPTGLKIINQIIELGHHIGLHFDESVFSSSADAELRDQVDIEREILKREFGKSVSVVSFHQPGNRILENRIKINCLNTYDRVDMKDVYYTSDSNLFFRGHDPCLLFKEGNHRLIQVLLHPEWWTVAELPLREKWARMLRNNLDMMQESLIEREAAFSNRIKVDFDCGDAD